MPMTDIIFELAVEGDVSLSERDKEQKNGGWGNSELLNEELEKVEFAIGIWDEDGYDKVYFATRSYHVKNEETGRVFHAHMKALLSKDDVVSLRSYLDFLVDMVDAKA